MFSACIRNQWHRQMGFLTMSTYLWSKGTDGNSLQEVRAAELLSSPFLCSGCVPPNTKGKKMESFLAWWPPPTFLSSCGNKATGIQCCPFPAPHCWPTRQPVIMAKRKAHTFTSPVFQVRQWDVGTFCTAQVTSAHLQGHHQTEHLSEPLQGPLQPLCKA